MKSRLKLLLTQIKWEQLTFWRNPASAGFTLGFPLMFLVIFTAINGNDRIELGGGEVRFSQYYVPAILAFGLISACYTNLAFLVSIRRENGMLKRTRGTPLSPATYFSGMIGNAVLVAVMISVLVIVLGLVAYEVTFPNRYLALAITVVVGAFCFSAWGIAVATFIPNEEAGSAIINFVIFPLLFISGTFGTVDPESLVGRVAAVFPVRAINRSAVAVFDPFVSGTGVLPQELAILLAWGVLGLVISVRRFSWDPAR